MAYFSKHGYEVTLISLTPGVVPGVQLHILGSAKKPGHWKYLQSGLRVRRIVKNLAPDILHAHYAGGYGVLGTVVGWHPFVVTVWGSEVLVVSRRSRMLRQVVKWVLRSADLVTCTAQLMVSEIENLGIGADRIEMIPFGVDEATFNSDGRTDQGLDKALTIVSTRALESIYCVHVLIEALGEVSNRFPDVRVIIVGDGQERRHLEGRVQESGLSTRVRFEGTVAPERVSQILKAANIYVSTSPTDTNHVSLNEAMACGAFPVVTDILANREWLVHGESGLLVMPNDPRDLAKKLIVALQDPSLRSRAAAINVRTIEIRGSFEKGMQANEALYLSLAHRQDGETCVDRDDG